MVSTEGVYRELLNKKAWFKGGRIILLFLFPFYDVVFA
jgi:hypothetical protein